MDKFKKNLLFGGILGLSLLGCSKEEFETPKEIPSEKPTELFDQVKILNTNDLNQISVVNSNMYFVKPTDFEEGAIIIGGISKNTPNGILKKISSISQDKKSVLTVPATLEEVLKDGTISLNTTLRHAQVENESKLKSSEGYEFHYPLEKIVIFDKDKNLLTTNDQITLKGNIYFDLDYNFSATFKNKLKEVGFATVIKQSSDLTLEGNVDEIVQKNINLYTQSFTPFLIPNPYLIPLVVRPILKIDAGIYGEIKGSTKFEARENFIATGVIKYSSGNWITTNNFDKGFDAEFTNSLKSNIKSDISPRLDLILNEIAGPYALTEGYFKLNVDSNKNPWWEIYGGVNVFAGINMGLLSNLIPDYEKRLIQYETLILSAPGGIEIPNSSPIAKLSIDPKKGTTQTEFILDATQSYDDNDHKENLFYRWDYEGDGIWDKNWEKGNNLEKFVYVNSGKYYPKLELKDSEGKIGNASQEIEVEKNERIKYSIYFDSRDKQHYQIVLIDGKWWFCENVNYYTKNSIYPERDSTKNHLFGRLYNWNEANKACPPGWRIPSKNEWYQMMEKFDSHVNPMETYSGNQIGNILKESGTVYWKIPNSGRNEIDFSIVGAGRDVGFRTDFFREESRIWTSDTDFRLENSRIVIGFKYNSPEVSYFPGPENYLFSLRFIKNE